MRPVKPRSLLGGAAAYGVFFYMARQGNATRLSALTFLTPLFAALAGYSVLGERLSGPQLAGGALTLAAVALVSANVRSSSSSSSSGP